MTTRPALPTLPSGEPHDLGAPPVRVTAAQMQAIRMDELVVQLRGSQLHGAEVAVHAAGMQAELAKLHLASAQRAARERILALKHEQGITSENFRIEEVSAPLESASSEPLPPVLE